MWGQDHFLETEIHKRGPDRFAIGLYYLGTSGEGISHRRQGDNQDIAEMLNAKAGK